jgi:hypothetical protein
MVTASSFQNCQVNKFLHPECFCTDPASSSAKQESTYWKRIFENFVLSNQEVSHLHHPSANLTKYQKGFHYLGVKVFNKLPTCIKEEVENTKKFKKILQKYLNEKSFCLLQEYFDLQN